MVTVQPRLLLRDAHHRLMGPSLGGDGRGEPSEEVWCGTAEPESIEVGPGCLPRHSATTAARNVTDLCHE